jgi:polyisoprenyl-phosphate glycosyltransferase
MACAGAPGPAFRGGTVSQTRTVSQAPDLSVVVPLYDEAESLPEALPAIRGVLESASRPFEILCIDDGSDDATASLLDEAARRDPRVVPVRLSRRFGKEAALSAGLEMARGRAVILMDADLQHPPSLIPEMLRLWGEGFEVVEAVRGDRGEEGVAYRLLARLFYALMGRSIGRRFQGATDFKLLDRQVVEAVLRCRERNRFFRGLVAWVGFRVAQIPLPRSPRLSGRSRWSAWMLVRYSVRSLMAFTSLPLRIVGWAGLVMVLLGTLLAVQTLYNYFSGRAVSGFTTVILVELILGGLILTSLGVLAFYIALIYDEQKARPLFIVRRGLEPLILPEPPDRPELPDRPPAPQRDEDRAR